MASFQKTFSQAGAYMALGFAKAFLYDRGFSFGPYGKNPAAGIRYGRSRMLPWNNMTDGQKNALDGFMAGDARTGPITITIRDTASPEAQKAIRK